MNHSPLKTALAYECFQDQDNSTLALPSDQKMKTGTSGRQRVQEQVLMTVRRQKSKSSQSSTLSHSNRGKGCARVRGVCAGSARGPCAPAPPRGGHIRGCRERGTAGEAGLRGANPELPGPVPPRSARAGERTGGSPGRGCQRRARLAPRPKQGREGARKQPASRKRPPGPACALGTPPFPRVVPAHSASVGTSVLGERRDFPLAPGWALGGALVQSVCGSPDQPTPGSPLKRGARGKEEDPRNEERGAGSGLL